MKEVIIKTLIILAICGAILLAISVSLLIIMCILTIIDPNITAGQIDRVMAIVMMGFIGAIMLFIGGGIAHYNIEDDR